MSPDGLISGLEPLVGVAVELEPDAFFVAVVLFVADVRLVVVVTAECRLEEPHALNPTTVAAAMAMRPGRARRIGGLRGSG